MTRHEAENESSSCAPAARAPAFFPLPRPPLLGPAAPAPERAKKSSSSMPTSGASARYRPSPPLALSASIGAEGAEPAASPAPTGRRAPFAPPSPRVRESGSERLAPGTPGASRGRFRDTAGPSTAAAAVAPFRAAASDEKMSPIALEVADGGAARAGFAVGALRRSAAGALRLLLCSTPRVDITGKHSPGTTIRLRKRHVSASTSCKKERQRACSCVCVCVRV